MLFFNNIVLSNNYSIATLSNKPYLIIMKGDNIMANIAKVVSIANDLSTITLWIGDGSTEVSSYDPEFKATVKKIDGTSLYDATIPDNKTITLSAAPLETDAIIITVNDGTNDLNRIFIDFMQTFEGGPTNSNYYYKTPTANGEYELNVTTINDEAALLPTAEKIYVANKPTASEILMTKPYLVKFPEKQYSIKLTLTGAVVTTAYGYEVSFNEKKL